MFNYVLTLLRVKIMDFSYQNQPFKIAVCMRFQLNHLAMALVSNK